MKRIKLTHGTAMVDNDISQKTIDALNKLSELAYNYEPKPCIITELCMICGVNNNLN